MSRIKSGITATITNVGPACRLCGITLCRDMAAAMKLTAIYEPVDEGWVQGRIAELPAVITAAPTLTEAKEMLRDALTEYLASLQSSPQSDAPGADREELELTIGS